VKAKKPDNLYENLPDSPGIYLMRDWMERVLYVGKAGNLHRRVSSYFLRPQEAKTERLLERIKKIDYEVTDTAIEALILESHRIKEFAPPFNVKEKDDKSFLWVLITKDELPRVLLARGKGDYGPFTSASSIREALRILRRIFSWSVHPPEKLGTFPRVCFDCEIGLCPGSCIGSVDRREYARNIKNLRLFFEGKKKQIIRSLTREMETASRDLDFERASKLRGQIFALQHIQDIALIGEEKLDIRNSGLSAPLRIEGYDISNISGTSAVGSMVVFSGDRPDKKEYRKFKIKTIFQSDDTGMLKEMLRRRFTRLRQGYGGQEREDYSSWPLPHIILIDGGKGQVNAAQSVLDEVGLRIPVVGIAKGPTRKKNEFVGEVPLSIPESILIKVRNEAHRFAISYHKEVRRRRFLS